MPATLVNILLFGQKFAKKTKVSLGVDKLAAGMTLMVFCAARGIQVYWTRWFGGLVNLAYLACSTAQDGFHPHFRGDRRRKRVRAIASEDGSDTSWPRTSE